VPSELEATDGVSAASSSPSAKGANREYPSLYDSLDTTLLAVGIGLFIVMTIQLLVARMFRTARTDYGYLTWFATGLVSCVVGVYVADMLIAGPDTELLSAQERLSILDFIKSICLMVFSYYFGLKSQPPKEGEDGQPR
jgi:hypothetical protein